MREPSDQACLVASRFTLIPLPEDRRDIWEGFELMAFFESLQQADRDTFEQLNATKTKQP